MAGVLLGHHDAHHQHTHPDADRASRNIWLLTGLFGCRSQALRVHAVAFVPARGPVLSDSKGGLIAASIRISESSCASSFLGRLLLARERKGQWPQRVCLLSGISCRSLPSAMDPIQCREAWEGIVVAGDLGRAQNSPEQP